MSQPAVVDVLNGGFVALRLQRQHEAIALLCLCARAGTLSRVNRQRRQRRVLEDVFAPVARRAVHVARKLGGELGESLRDRTKSRAARGLDIHAARGFAGAFRFAGASCLFHVDSSLLCVPRVARRKSRSTRRRATRCRRAEHVRGTCVAALRPMTAGTRRTLLEKVEEATSDALTLAEGLAPEQLLRSRLTRREVNRQLLLVATTLSSLGQAERDSMPELDWEAWAAVARGLVSAEQESGDILWTTVHSLAPVTLTWLRLYRSQSARRERL